MKITTEIKYEETYLPPRCRKLRQRTATRTVITMVKEISPEEAPVAIREETLFNGEAWKEYRFYKGKLYARARYYLMDEGIWTIMDRKYLESKYSHYALYDRPYAKAVSELRKAIHDCLIINDEVWTLSGEPRYVVMTFGLGHNQASTDLMTDTSCNRNISDRAYFNALQRDEALAEAKRVALARGDTNSIPQIGTFWRLEVLLPEAVRFQPKHGKNAHSGNPFMATCEDLIESSGTSTEAACLVVAMALTQGGNT